MTLGSQKCMVLGMAKMGRPTDDPKTLRVTVRLTPRDLEALGKVARQRRVSLAEALRLVMRGALGVPALPKKGKANHD